MAAAVQGTLPSKNSIKIIGGNFVVCHGPQKTLKEWSSACHGLGHFVRRLVVSCSMEIVSFVKNFLGAAYLTRSTLYPTHSDAAFVLEEGMTISFDVHMYGFHDSGNSKQRYGVQYHANH